MMNKIDDVKADFYKEYREAKSMGSQNPSLVQAILVVAKAIEFLATILYWNH